MDDAKDDVERLLTYRELEWGNSVTLRRTSSGGSATSIQTTSFLGS